MTRGWQDGGEAYMNDRLHGTAGGCSGVPPPSLGPWRSCQTAGFVARMNALMTFPLTWPS
jgi:hypothetical protein